MRTYNMTSDEVSNVAAFLQTTPLWEEKVSYRKGVLSVPDELVGEVNRVLGELRKGALPPRRKTMAERLSELEERVASMETANG